MGVQPAPNFVLNRKEKWQERPRQIHGAEERRKEENPKSVTAPFDRQAASQLAVLLALSGLNRQDSDTVQTRGAICLRTLIRAPSTHCTATVQLVAAFVYRFPKLFLILAIPSLPPHLDHDFISLIKRIIVTDTSLLHQLWRMLEEFSVKL